MRSVSSSPAVGSTVVPPGYTRAPGHSRLDDRRESASADAGYAVLEKKVHSNYKDTHLSVNTLFKKKNLNECITVQVTLLTALIIS